LNRNTVKLLGRERRAEEGSGLKVILKNEHKTGGSLDVNSLRRVRITFTKEPVRRGGILVGPWKIPNKNVRLKRPRRGRKMRLAKKLGETKGP